MITRMSPDQPGHRRGGQWIRSSRRRAGAAMDCPLWQSSSVVLRFLDYELDADRRELRRGGEAVAVEPQVFDVLVYLVVNRDRMVAKNELMDEVWGDRFVSESAVSSRIKSARQAVGDSGREQQVIKTMHGRGYRFVADVVEPDVPYRAGSMVAGRGDGRESGMAVRYARTVDGASIAYCIMGSGPVLVRCLGWLTNLEVEAASTIGAGFWQNLAERFTVVRYDGRGMGLSDRDHADFSTATKVLDLQAVVDAAEFDEFSLLGLSDGGSVAVAYAADHADRVQSLILYGSFMRFGGDGPGSARRRERQQAMITLVEQYWGSDAPLFRQVFTSIQMPEGDADQLEYFDELQRASTGPQTAARFLASIYETDVSDEAARVRVPTLVLHRRGDLTIPWKWGQRLATTIDEARFMLVGGANHQIWVGDEPEVVAMIDAIRDIVSAS